MIIKLCDCYIRNMYFLVSFMQVFFIKFECTIHSNFIKNTCIKNTKKLKKNIKILSKNYVANVTIT